MQTLKRLNTMDHLTAGDFAKIIATLLLCAAKPDELASDNHKGVHVSLMGRRVIFSAIRYGQTTEVEVLTETHYGNERHFLLSHEDLDSLYVILAHDASAPVQFEASRQPQTHGECLCVHVSDWYTGFMGSKREPKHPLRTKPTRTRTASAVDIETTMNNLTRLADVARFKVDQFAGRGPRETIVSVLQPLPGFFSVKSYLY